MLGRPVILQAMHDPPLAHEVVNLGLEVVGGGVLQKVDALHALLTLEERTL